MLRTSHLRPLGLMCLALSALALSYPTQAQLTTGSQNVNGNRNTPQYTDNGTTYGPYGWTYSYTRGFDGTKLYKDIQIDFQFDAALNYTPAQQTAYKAAVEAGIESVWDNKFAIVDNKTQTAYPIIVDITTAGPFNQTVQVHPGTGRDDMLNWYVDSTNVANAHEVGHMMGLYDEYLGGAVDQYPNPTLSNDGLMGLGALNAIPVMYPRYFQQYLDYMNTLNPGGNFSLLATTPEPGTYALFLSGGGALFLVRRRRRTKA